MRWPSMKDQTEPKKLAAVLVQAPVKLPFFPGHPLSISEAAMFLQYSTCSETARALLRVLANSLRISSVLAARNNIPTVQQSHICSAQTTYWTYDHHTRPSTVYSVYTHTETSLKISVSSPSSSQHSIPRSSARFV